MCPEPTVFVVDDDAAVRDSLLCLGRSAKLHVEAFASARAFLDMISVAPERTGCIVVDYGMPDMNGLDLWVCLSTEGIRLPTIMMTGHVDLKDCCELVDREGIELMQKPFRPLQLLERIQRLLEQCA